jgi:hypothetical protein
MFTLTLSRINYRYSITNIALCLAPTTYCHIKINFYFVSFILWYNLSSIVPVYVVEHSFILYGASCIYGFKCPFKYLTSLDPEFLPVRAIQFVRDSLERRTLLHFSTSSKFLVPLHWLWHMLFRRYNDLYIWSSFSEVSIHLLILLEIVFFGCFCPKISIYGIPYSQFVYGIYLWIFFNALYLNASLYGVQL